MRCGQATAPAELAAPININVPDGDSLGERVKRRTAELAAGYDFTYGAGFPRLVARR